MNKFNTFIKARAAVITQEIEEMRAKAPYYPNFSFDRLEEDNFNLIRLAANLRKKFGDTWYVTTIIEKAVIMPGDEDLPIMGRFLYNVYLMQNFGIMGEAWREDKLQISEEERLELRLNKQIKSLP